MRCPRTCCLAMAVLLAMTVQLGAKTSELEIGSKAPSWKELKGTDGKAHSLGDLEDAEAIVVVFTCNGCPVARAYEDRLVKLAKAYQDKGVKFVAINANRPETLEQMATRAKEKEFPYAYIRDDSREVAKSYGALRTPEVFLLNKDREVAYMGAIDDDSSLQGRPEVHYLQDAIDAVLAGKEPPKTKTTAFGCTIKW